MCVTDADSCVAYSNGNIHTDSYSNSYAYTDSYSYSYSYSDRDPTAAAFTDATASTDTAAASVIG